MADADERESYLTLAQRSDQMADAATARAVAMLHRKLAVKFRALADCRAANTDPLT